MKSSMVGAGVVFTSGNLKIGECYKSSEQAIKHVLGYLHEELCIRGDPPAHLSDLSVPLSLSSVSPRVGLSGLQNAELVSAVSPLHLLVLSGVIVYICTWLIPWLQTHNETPHPQEHLP